MSVINGVVELSEIVAKKISGLQLKSLWDQGDYHYETAKPGLLLEFRIDYPILDRDNIHAKQELCFIVNYYGDNNSEEIQIAAIPHFRTYTHKQLVREIHKALSKEMFRLLGTEGKMIFDEIDHFKELQNKTNSDICKLTERAQNDFHRGYQYVRGNFKQLTQVAVQF